MNKGDLLMREDGAMFKVYHVLYEEEDSSSPKIKYAVFRMSDIYRKISLVYIYPADLENPHSFQLILLTETDLNSYQLIKP